MSDSLAYLGTSAYLKLVVPRAETNSLKHWLRSWADLATLVTNDQRLAPAATSLGCS